MIQTKSIVITGITAHCRKYDNDDKERKRHGNRADDDSRDSKALAAFLGFVALLHSDDRADEPRKGDEEGKDESDNRHRIRFSGLRVIILLRRVCRLLRRVGRLLVLRGGGYFLEELVLFSRRRRVVYFCSADGAEHGVVGKFRSAMFTKHNILSFFIDSKHIYYMHKIAVCQDFFIIHKKFVKRENCLLF